MHIFALLGLLACSVGDPPQGYDAEVAKATGYSFSLCVRKENDTEEEATARLFRVENGHSDQENVRFTNASDTLGKLLCTVVVQHSPAERVVYTLTFLGEQPRSGWLQVLYTAAIENGEPTNWSSVPQQSMHASRNPTVMHVDSTDQHTYRFTIINVRPDEVLIPILPIPHNGHIRPAN